MYKVYGLKEGRSREYRYVGVTSGTVKKRLAEHVALARKGEIGLLYDWIRELISVGRQPNSTLLEEEERDPYQRESYWMNRLHNEGHPLLNRQFHKETMSPQVKEKISEAMKEHRKTNPPSENWVSAGKANLQEAGRKYREWWAGLTDEEKAVILAERKLKKNLRKVAQSDTT